MINNTKSSKSQEELENEFIESCEPLEDLLDSVRDIEGFPIAEDKDILALSDPPWYTACPNPYINKFIKTFGTPYDEETDDYHREPFVTDVSEGKNDPIYNAHSYHTKVPHKAIMKFIEHYTDEGDIVFDGFCGTGMTGVAAQMLNRRSVLCDLSPAATYISYNYNVPVDAEKFEKEATGILEEVEKECGWMYETYHTDGAKGRINYTVWSDKFICPFCENEYVFWDAAVNKENGTVIKEYSCPHCNSKLTKRDCKRASTIFYDEVISKNTTRVKQVPVLINYNVGKKRYEKEPDNFDLELINKIDQLTIPYWFPTDKIPEGEKTCEPIRLGVKHIHQFYTKRNLWILSLICNKLKYNSKFWFTSSIINLAITARYKFKRSGNVPLSGTIYISSLPTETNPVNTLKNKIRYLKAIGKTNTYYNFIQTTQSSSYYKNIKNDVIDYIFTDPPFGDNLMYSELNFIWESWLKVFTNNQSEAIVNSIQKKGLNEYKELMTKCFKEMYRILKPKRWITVEFHNSKPSVWNAIQDAMTRAGFVVAQVAVLDKKQGSFNQVTAAGAVKNDLVINAYKPSQELEQRFLKEAGRDLEKDFIEEHLEHLPVEPNIERTEQMLYSKMLAKYVQNGYEIRLNAKKFYEMLRDNFVMMDGFWFNDNQIQQYDGWKKQNGLQALEEIRKGQQMLFVNDEKSAVIWLYHFLAEPKSYSDILTAYNQIVTSVEDEIPELQSMLQANFVFEDGMYRRPLNEKEKEDKEEQSEKELLRAFDKILGEARSSSKKIKSVRKEAIKRGFEESYRQKHYQDILDVAAKLNKKILENDSEINDFVEIASIKAGENSWF